MLPAKGKQSAEVGTAGCWNEAFDHILIETLPPESNQRVGTERESSAQHNA